MRRFVYCPLLAVLLFSGTSCSRQAAKRETVQGHVFYHGTALQGGTIVFIPDAERGGDGPLAIAEIKPDGSYSLLTDKVEGAPSGHYRVTIAANAPISVDLSRPPLVLPKLYSDPEKSGLKREVKAGEVNVIDFPLD